MRQAKRIVCWLFVLLVVVGIWPVKDGDIRVKAETEPVNRSFVYLAFPLAHALRTNQTEQLPLAAAVQAIHRDTSDELVLKKDKHRPVRYLQKFRGNISAYTNGLRETGKTSRHPYYGITASGHRTKAGYTVAAGRHIPFGTVLYIEGIGYRTVHDRGGAIKGNKIDVFMSDMGQVKKFGRRHLDVYIVKWGDGKRKRR
jgi:3D (Asp-Asp-Asp) domain-containing protein